MKHAIAWLLPVLRTLTVVDAGSPWTALDFDSIAADALSFAFKYDEPWNRADLSALNYNEKLNARQPGRCPHFTKEGYSSPIKIPGPLYTMISDHYEKNRGRKTREYEIAGYFNNRRVPNFMVDVTYNMRQAVWTTLTPLLESWIRPTCTATLAQAGVKCKLEPTAVYGIRE
jgi:hypothetical protein